jgi:hypothetical protein
MEAMVGVVLLFSYIFAGAHDQSAFSYQRWLFVVLHFSCIFVGAHDLVFAFGQRWLFAVRSFYPSPLLFSSHFPRRSSHDPSSFLLSSPLDFYWTAAYFVPILALYFWYYFPPASRMRRLISFYTYIHSSQSLSSSFSYFN